MQIGQNPKDEFEKVGFPVFAILRKNLITRSGRGHCKVIQLHSGNLGIQCFWMYDIRFESYRQKHVGLGYSAPCRRIYVFFCVLDIRRSLDQPSKLYHPPLHGLACSATFSRRKIKIIKTASSDEQALAVRTHVGACCYRLTLPSGLTRTTPSVSVFPMIWWAVPPVGIKVCLKKRLESWMQNIYISRGKAC